MKEKIVKDLNTVLGALGNISVKGKPNLSNLIGSMNILESVVFLLSNENVVISEKKKEK